VTDKYHEGKDERTMAETPTWAVAGVCFVLLAISIFIEHIIEATGKVIFY
jgi:mlo protein